MSTNSSGAADALQDLHNELYRAQTTDSVEVLTQAVGKARLLLARYRDSLAIPASVADALTPESGLSIKKAWWAGARTGLGLAPDTPRPVVAQYLARLCAPTSVAAAPSEHPPSRHCGCIDCAPSFEAAPSAAALSAATGAIDAREQEVHADLIAFVEKFARGKVRDHMLSSIEDEASALYFRAVRS